MATLNIGKLNPQLVVGLDSIRANMVSAAGLAPSIQAKFQFLASFDGTNNDGSSAETLRLSGSTHPTNIWNLFEQGRTGSAAVRSEYFRGVGTGGEMGGLINAGVAPTGPISVAAENANRTFTAKAREFLDSTQGSTIDDVSVSIAGVSRGGPTGILFARMLYERGLRDEQGELIKDSNGTPVAPPGSIKIGAVGA